MDSCEVQNGSVKFVSNLEEGKWLDVTRCIFTRDSDLEMMFYGNSELSSPYLRVEGIRKEDAYLVFYDGKLMMESIDYRLQKNIIIFLNELILDVTKKIVVLRI